MLYEMKLMNPEGISIDEAISELINAPTTHRAIVAACKIMQRAASKEFYRYGVRMVKIEMINKERDLDTCEYFFRNCVAEAENREIIYFAKNYLMNTIDDAEFFRMVISR